MGTPSVLNAIVAQAAFVFCNDPPMRVGHSCNPRPDQPEGRVDVEEDLSRRVVDDFRIEGILSSPADIHRGAEAVGSPGEVQPLQGIDVAVADSMEPRQA